MPLSPLALALALSCNQVALKYALPLMFGVRIKGRTTLLQWRSIRFRPPTRAYTPWGKHVGGRTESKTIAHPKITPAFNCPIVSLVLL